MSDVIIYTTDDGVTKIDLQLENGTVWLSQLQIAELFQTSKQNISKHIQAIFDDGELDAQATVNQQLTVAQPLPLPTQDCDPRGCGLIDFEQHPELIGGGLVYEP